jgi:hypothetical protein
MVATLPLPRHLSILRRPQPLFPQVQARTTDLTSLLSEASKPSLETVKRSSLGAPPVVTYPYSPALALDDIPGISYTLDFFLKSLMVESEECCDTSLKSAPYTSSKCRFVAQTGTYCRERLYFTTGLGLIQCVKALMSFEDDIRDCPQNGKSAPQCVGPSIRNRSHQAWKCRCERTSEEGCFPSLLLAGYVTGSSGINWVKNMTAVDRHAELVYAESLFEKACLFL